MKSLTSIDEILHNQPEIRTSSQAFFDEKTSFPLNIEGLHGSLFSLFTAEVCHSNHIKALQSAQYSASSKSGPEYKIFSSDLVIVVPTEADARDIAGDFTAVYEDAEIHIFPDWGTVPYRPAARGSATFGKRAGVLSKLLSKKDSIHFHENPRIFLFTQRAFMSPLPCPEYLKSLSFKLSKGDKLDTTNIAQKLSGMGYTRVPKVNVRGEFSLRGEVLDIYLPCDEHASRVIFDFDEIESFKEFETDTQTTIGSKKDLLIYPTKEILWTDELVEKARVRMEEYQESAIKEDGADSSQILEMAGTGLGTGSESSFAVHLPLTEKARQYLENLLTGLSVSGEAEGEEFLYQLVNDRNYSLLDYIDQNTFVLFYNYDKQENARLTINREYNKLYRTSREEYPVLPPDMTLLDYEKTLENVSKCILFRTLQKADEVEKGSRYQISAEPARSFFGNINFMKEELQKLQNDGWNIYIYTDNENQQLRIHEIFKDFVDIKDDGAIHPVILIPKAISAGFRLPEAKLLVIQENEIFGRRQYVPKSVNKAKSKAIDTFVELNPGDYIVHVNWGIGLFHGIERVKAMGNERDYIKLEYADSEFAFVPIEQVNLVQRYIGNEGEKPRLDRIGSKAWENRKNKVKQAVEDIAQKLIDLYSRRQASVGFAFPKETEWQAAFEAAFPYEDTPDQITVTEEIKADMEKPVPMDRLVC